MPRLRSATGVVVNVSDEQAARLGSQYTPYADAEKAPAKSTAKKASSSKTEK